MESTTIKLRDEMDNMKLNQDSYTNRRIKLNENENIHLTNKDNQLELIMDERHQYKNA